MRPTISIARWVGGRVALFMLAMLSLPAAAAPLFPEPLHLVRRIEDPISQTVATIDQYCAGNRIVTVRGAIVSVVDYDRGEMMVIDRSNATYSITTFGELAKAQQPLAVQPERGALARTSLGVRHDATGPVDEFEIVDDRGATRMVSRVAIDRSVRLSREAVEALIGAAHPQRRTRHHAAILEIAASGSDGRTFGLPAQQITTYEIEGEKLSVRSELVRITREDAPPDLLAIPPGAVRVESPATALPRLLEELDGVRRR